MTQAEGFSFPRARIKAGKEGGTRPCSLRWLCCWARPEGQVILPKPSAHKIGGPGGRLDVRSFSPLFSLVFFLPWGNDEWKEAHKKFNCALIWFLVWIFKTEFDCLDKSGLMEIFVSRDFGHFSLSRDILYSARENWGCCHLGLSEPRKNGSCPVVVGNSDTNWLT